MLRFLWLNHGSFRFAPSVKSSGLLFRHCKSTKNHINTQQLRCFYTFLKDIRRFKRRQKDLKTSEGIADGEMQTLTISEARHIIEAVFVGNVYTYTPVKTQHKEVEVISDAYACS